MLGKPEIEYFYSPHSAFAYIGASLLQTITIRTGARVIHRPFNLERVVTATSGRYFGSQSERHRQYFFDREIERWAEYRKMPIVNFRPSFHDEDMKLPACLLIAAQEHDYNVDQLSLAILQAHWRDDANIADYGFLLGLLNGLGIDGASLLDKANDPHCLDLYERNTTEAIGRSVFGSPTYFVKGDMFYGQDRLELVERALNQPFAGNWPK